MKLVHDIWWTFFCQEPKLILKCQGVCQTWKEWVDMLNLKQIYSNQEKRWIWKNVCWIGNVKLIQKWEDLDIHHFNGGINDWYLLILPKWNYGLMKACQCGNHELVDLMIKKGADHWNMGLYGGACRYGNHDMLDYMIEKGADDWNYGLYGACRYGNHDMLDYMIEKGADDWNYGLYNTCYGGNHVLVDLMIKKGANHWNLGLNGACYGRKRELADLMIEKGATNTYFIDIYFPS